jgi:hypothetical protein
MDYDLNWGISETLEEISLDDELKGTNEVQFAKAKVKFSSKRLQKR